MAQILFGKKLANKILAELSGQILSLKTGGVTPQLAIVLAGQNPASWAFIQTKQKMAQKIGVRIKIKKANKTINPSQLKKIILDLNRDKNIHGIIVQLPLPRHLNLEEILATIEPAKDVDGLGPKSKFSSATALGIIHLLKYYNFHLKNQRVTILGKGVLVGKPLAKLMKRMGARVISCDRRTKNIERETKKADILISATGQPNLVSGSMVKKGAVVIDCGAPQPEIDFEQVKKVVKAVSPVPGGVGPVTVAELLKNVVWAAGGS